MPLAKRFVVALAFGLCSLVVFAQNTSTDTVRSRVPGDGAVKADPKPKPSQVGQPATVFHTKVKTTKPKEPPTPVVTSTTTKKN
jgi:hypothetical protein